MATGTLRYWAAARAAAGVEAEPYTADTLADALHAAADRHGAELAGVLTRCSFLVDGHPVGSREHAAVLLPHGGEVDVLPPFAGGAEPASTAAPPTRPGPAPRPGGGGLVVGGLLAAAVAGALAGLAWVGVAALAGGLFLLQAVLAQAWLAVTETPGGRGALVVAVGSAGVAGGLVATTPGGEVRRLAGVLGVAVLAALVHQLVRRQRPRVVDSFAGTLSAVALVVAALGWVSLRGGPLGRQAAVAGLAGVGVALLAGRALDAVVRRPFAVLGTGRGWAGTLAGLVAGTGVSTAYGAASTLGTAAGLRIGAVAAALAVGADLAVTLALAGLPEDADERQRAAVAPTAVLIPLAVAAPAVYLTGRILLG